MKYFAILAVLAFTGGVGYGAFNGSSSGSETVHVLSHTVSGNITTTRNNENDNSGQLATFDKAILKQKLDAKRVVYLNSEVNFQSVAKATAELKELEAKSSDPIWLLIDSPGGSVLDGTTLISQIEASRAPVNTVCTRLCASMAAMIHSYGAKRYSLDRAILMYHPASGGAQGQVPNMLSMMTTISRYVNKMNANIIKRSNMKKEEYDRLVSYELWIDSEDALQRGFIDGIVSLNVPNHEGAAQAQAPDSDGDSTPTPNVKPKRRTFDVQMILGD